MNILIIYETVEGQTRKVSEFLEQQFRSAGHEVRLINTKERPETISFKGIDKIVLAAPVHERRHPKGFEDFVSANLEALEARQTLLISISLKAAFSESLEEAQDYLTEMEMRTGLRPNREILAGGAVRTDSYGYFESQVVNNVVLGERKVDLVDGVCEFTDWEKLSREANAFLKA